MSDDPKEENKPSIKSAFEEKRDADKGRPALFKPEEMDIYVNKVTNEAYIFHSKKVKKDIKRLEYDPTDHSVTVVKEDDMRLDLGVKLQWLVRPYFTRAREIGIIQTKDGETLDGFFVPLYHNKQDHGDKPRKREKRLEAHEETAEKTENPEE